MDYANQLTVITSNVWFNRDNDMLHTELIHILLCDYYAGLSFPCGSAYSVRGRILSLARFARDTEITESVYFFSVAQ
jgi:hypothetical protein